MKMELVGTRSKMGTLFGFLMVFVLAACGKSGGVGDSSSASVLDELSPDQIAEELKALDDAGESAFIFDRNENLSDVQVAPGQDVLVEVYVRPRGFGIQQEFMVISSGGRLLDATLVSTAKSGKVTPSGTYSIERMHKRWSSTIYKGALMDWAMFFKGPFAIHSTMASHYDHMGRPASSGCVRLTRPNARELFKMAQKVGPSNVTIKIYGSGAQLANFGVNEIKKLLEKDYKELKQLIKDRNRGKKMDRGSAGDE